MKKLIIKIIYFLLRFVNSEITSYEQFNKNIREAADGEYYSTVIERSTHVGESPTTIFKGYIAGKGWEEGSTPQEVMDSFLNIKEESINTIIN